MKINEMAIKANNFVDQHRWAIASVVTAVALVAGFALGIAVSPTVALAAFVSTPFILTALACWPEASAKRSDADSQAEVMKALVRAL